MVQILLIHLLASILFSNSQFQFIFLSFSVFCKLSSSGNLQNLQFFHISNEAIFTHVINLQQLVLRSIPISPKEVLVSQAVDQLKVAAVVPEKFFWPGRGQARRSSRAVLWEIPQIPPLASRKTSVLLLIFASKCGCRIIGGLWPVTPNRCLQIPLIMSKT